MITAATAGTGFVFTVAADNGDGSIDTSYRGSVHFSSTDTQAALPANSSLTSGVGIFSGTLKTAGRQTLTASDTVANTVAATTAAIAVTAASASHLILSAPTSVTAGVGFAIVVSALDPFNNVAQTYTGSVAFTSSDSLATLPAGSLLNQGIGSFSATLETAGTQSMTATDTVVSSLTAHMQNIVVNAAPPSRLLVTTPGSETAGVGFLFTVTAEDQFNNLAANYTGTIHFTGSDGSGTYPANATLTSGVGTFTATLTTAGTQTLTATDANTSTITGHSGAITLAAASASHFVFADAGVATSAVGFKFTVTAEDPFNNVATGYTGTVGFTGSDGTGTYPANSTLTSGVGSFSATVNASGSQTLTATDATTATITGHSGTITVSAGAATHFVFVAPSTAIAAVGFTFTVQAEDAHNNVATGYTGTVHFAGSDGSGVYPANSTLVSGAGTFSATFDTAGSQTLTATDTVTSSITGHTGTITTSGATPTHIVVVAPSNATAGVAIHFTITVEDQFNNPSTGYTGTVIFTGTDGAATYPANSTVSAGTGVFTATLVTVGSQTLTATDSVSGAITGHSGTITLAAAGANHILVVGPANGTAGVGLTFTITVQDAFNNTVTGYTGTVAFTGTSSGSYPGNSTVASGMGVFTATLDTAGSQTITATDTVTGSIKGHTGTITIAAAAASQIAVVAPGNATAGVGFAFTITVEDAFGNAAVTYTGTVGFTGSDPAGEYPGNSTVTSGTGTFTATLVTAANQTLTATDTVTGTIKGHSGTIVTAATTATTIVVSAPSTATAGVVLVFTITVEDTYGNVATGYTGTVAFTSTDGQAVLPANSTVASGTGSFSVTFKTSGTQTITATDTVTGTIKGHSGSIAVAANVATHFVFVVPSSATGDAGFAFTLSAEDAYNNVATTYAGTLAFTSSDKAAILPGNTQLSAGTGNFSATLESNGNQTLTATDVSAATLTGHSSAINVNVPYDLVVALRATPGTIQVLLGNGNGTFAAPVNYTAAEPIFYVLSTADLNNDGRPDLATEGNNLTSVLLGNGNGTFLPLAGPSLVADSGDTYGMVLADFNNDGNVDMALTRHANQNVAVLLGNGNGTFQAPAYYGVLNTVGPVKIAAGDINGDGNLDLAVADYGSNNVSTLLGNGNGTFQGRQDLTAGVSGSHPWGVALGVTGASSHLDIATALSAKNCIAVLLGNGNGTFAAAATYGTSGFPANVAFADVNADGKLDLVVLNNSSNTIGVLLGNGNGTFQAQQAFGALDNCQSFTVADLNGDGNLDIATTNYSANTVIVLLGNGNGTFQTGQTFSVGSKPYDLVAIRTR
jgi:hypothetical protein